MTKQLFSLRSAVLVTFALGCLLEPIVLTAASMPVDARETDVQSVEVTGRGFEIATLADGGKAFANRRYVWRAVPKAFSRWQFTRLSGGLRSTLTAVAENDGLLYMATASSGNVIDTTGWTKVGTMAFRYTDRNRTAVAVFTRPVRAGQTVTIPQGNWTGGILLAPSLEGKAVGKAVAPHSAGALGRARHATVPGVIVNYSPAVSRTYIGSPSIAALPNGDYVASHDFFGPGVKHKGTVVFASTDKGRSWKELARQKAQWFSTLFVHKGKLYLIGRGNKHANMVVRRSSDGGRTWTEPKDAKTGLLRDDGRYHCAPTPVVAHGGRLWRGFELTTGPRLNWQVLVASVDTNGDLLDATNWRTTAPLQHLWSKSQWIEGCVVAAPEGGLVNILRTNGQGDDKAAITHISPDGRTLSHDRTKDIIDFPGGGVKFSIRYDPKTRRYWSIGSKQSDPKAYRNTLVLTSSADLRHWKVESTLLYHPDVVGHAWQYVSWLFEGNDIIFVSRTAWDGAHRAHDANYLTFHRVRDFRDRTVRDEPIMAHVKSPADNRNTTFLR